MLYRKVLHAACANKKHTTRFSDLSDFCRNLGVDLPEEFISQLVSQNLSDPAFCASACQVLTTRNPTAQSIPTLLQIFKSHFEDPFVTEHRSSPAYVLALIEHDAGRDTCTICHITVSYFL